MDKVLQEIPWPEETPTGSAIRRWLRISAYGHYPHPQGLQCIDRVAVQAMVEHFKSFRGRLRRRFGGLPVYIGHPDDPQLRQQPGHQDTRAYAWIQDLEAREDGLHGLIKWSDAGLELLRNAFFKFFSPRWEMQVIGPGQFRPIRLLSIGLTNYPNIPGDAIANQEVSEGKAPAAVTREEAYGTSPGHPVPADDTLRKETGISAELEHFLAQGLNGGHILPNECAAWARRYGEDPERASEEMQAQKHGLHLQAHSASLQEANPSAASREQILSHVHRRIRDFGESYTDAWAAVRQSYPQLF
ncbi:MAG: phage protease [Puniceicoccales bacterium]|jgi:hypothetical protein|nr:phage protease [Puniceicoccales bacterium]